MDYIGMGECEKCGNESYYIYDTRESREENICLNEVCGYFTITFENHPDFDPHSVHENYSKFLYSLECSERCNTKYYWGTNTPSEVKDFIEKNEIFD